ncbi:uncharacterized protein LOC113509880 [Galleria mellonella]|uniref:Uncharacterized protein LOC113509880 n=1 Tax=Galleria mellonella TaxID=7137 RepID=A0A6J3C437_GALME|nr:uncharacterized protein LOC113509880 [Galleria mellonella]
MNNIKLCIFILLLAILCSDSKRWYSASVTERDEHFKVTNFHDFNPNFTQDDARIYIPVLTKNSVNHIDEKWHIPESPQYNGTLTRLHKWNLNQDNIQSGSLKHRNTNITTSEKSTLKTEAVRSYNNNINIINVIRRRPNKKTIRKKCPMVKYHREDKKLYSNLTDKRRFLEVFEVVQFEHVSCVSSSGLEGTCLHEYDCQASEGIPMGTCADGYGTCCVNEFKCDDHASALVGWFTNPGFPSPSMERLSCTITLSKASEDIKQIRLDFVNFELLPPSAGTCEEDQFIVSGQNINNVIPILCGINTGQHAYLEVGDVDGPLYFSVQTVSAENRLFSIKITQLTSFDELAAPNGCFQFFVESHGYMESFNYRDKSDIGIPRYQTYLNNMNYAMCIKRAPGTCSVTYSKSDNMQIVNYDTDGLPVIPPGQAGVEIFNCPNDWLLISAIRLCGDRLNDGSVLQDFSLDASITDNNGGPIVVWFRSDGGYVGRGFKLHYQQNTCNDRAV